MKIAVTPDGRSIRLDDVWDKSTFTSPPDDEFLPPKNSIDVQVGDNVMATSSDGRLSNNRLRDGGGNVLCALVEHGAKGTVIKRDDKWGYGWETMIQIYWTGLGYSQAVWLHSPHGKPLDSYGQQRLENYLRECKFVVL